VYARHGRELMGCKSPVCESGKCVEHITKVLAEGKGGTVRDRPEEASGKAMSRRTEMAYKAQSPGKVAPHTKAQGSGERVNAAVV
jgi:hypothetical protein